MQLAIIFYFDYLKLSTKGLAVLHCSKNFGSMINICECYNLLKIVFF